MRPLVEELDESAGQQNQGSGPGPVNVPGLDLLTHSSSLLSAGQRSRVDLDEVTVPASGPRAQTGPADLDQGRSPGTPGRPESCGGPNHDGPFMFWFWFQVGSPSTS